MVKVAFLHPDLGIGGAERLVVDAAVALQVALRRSSFQRQSYNHFSALDNM